LYPACSGNRSGALPLECRFPSAGDLGRAALAAARGAAPAEPERSVATGAATPETGPLPAPRQAQVEHIDIGDRAAPSSVAAAVSTVYVLDPLQRDLIAVDHGSGQVAGRVPVGRGASFVVLDEFADDRAWVANQAENSVTEI
jgi:hypothetical protein